ncbi:MAG: glycosyltransferase family 4 protein [Edaphobacter sp.]
MKVLFATGHLPSLQKSQAGAKTSYGICEYLSRTEEVHLLAFATESEIELLVEQEMAIFASWQYLPVTKGSRALSVLSSPSLPLAIAARTSAAYRQRLKQMFLEDTFDAVLFDHTAMLQYAIDVPTGIVTLGSIHDILSQGWERQAAHAKNPLYRSLLGIEKRRVMQWERRAFGSVDIVFPHSEKDRRLVGKLSQLGDSLMAIQPLVDASVLEKSGKRYPKSDSLLFWGAMDRVENIDAVQWIADEILLRIRKEIPTAHLYIAGRKSDRLGHIFGRREDISLLGFIDDVEGMMGSMEIALLPLRLGAGIKVKTLECMAAAMPVVTTEVGAEGIDARVGKDLLVANDAEGIAEKAILLLRDKASAQKIGESGRMFIEEMYDFDEKIEAIRDRMLQLTAQKKSAGRR